MTVGKGNSTLGAGSSRSIELARRTSTTRGGSRKNNDVVTRERNGATSSQRSTTIQRADGRTSTSTKGRARQGQAEGTGIENSMYSAPLVSREVSAERSMGERRVTGNLPGGIKGEAFVKGPTVSLEGHASADINRKGLDVDVELKIDADLVRAGASATREFNIKVGGEDVKVKVNLGAEGNVGINGELRLHISAHTDGIHISASADGFAGARGALKGGIELQVNGKDVVNADLSVEARAGVGAGASFEGGLNNFRARAYAAAGVGVGVEIGGKYDLLQAGKAAAAMALPFHQGW